MSGKFSVSILWGSDSYREDSDDKPALYEFETQKELDAFLEGVDEAAGYLEYEIVEVQNETNPDN